MSQNVSTRAYLGIGTNLGDRLAFLQGALDALRGRAGVSVLATSAVYETAPIGGPEQGQYLNAVIEIDTSLDCDELLVVAQQLEVDAQRVREVRWGPRTLDVDVLLFGDVVQDDPRLTLPHPRMFERAFVLIPLRDIAPSLIPAGCEAVMWDPTVVRFPQGLV